MQPCKPLSVPFPSPQIGPEPVFYVGYYSAHEQSMQTLLRKQLDKNEAALRKLLERAAVDCRRDQGRRRMMKCKG